jgi:uncharacterized protein (TIGR00661 family)
MRVLFAVNSNGLGHATRCIPLISEVMSKKHEVYILSNYRALEYLKKEFKDSVKEYFTLPDYSLQEKTFTANSVSVRRFIMHLPLYIQEFGQEFLRFTEIQKKYRFERIITDTRFGIYAGGVPCYLINHHVKFPFDGFLRYSSPLTELMNYAFKDKFRKILIPDFKKDSLSGDFTHNLSYFTDQDIEYLGILSMTRKMKVKEDIDYFFSISGPEPQRTVFEKKVMKAVSKIKDKNIVITLGKTESGLENVKGNVKIYGYLDKEKQTGIMNRSKLVITRSGYTTLMDLAELGKKALLIPTKGQPEQEYLAKYHLKHGNFYYKDLDELNMPKDLDIAERFPGYICKHKTEESVKRFMRLVFEKEI